VIGQFSRANRLEIRTAEGISFSLWLAGPTTRFLAWAIDVGFVIMLMVVLSIVASFMGAVLPDIAAATMAAGSYIILTGYAMTLEWFLRGQTFGKRLLRLRVVDERGLKLTFSQVALRNLMRIADALPLLYLVGGVTCFLNSRRQRLGDLAANTVVIHEPKLREPDLSQIRDDKYNSLRAYPHLAARLRQLVTPQEAGLALDALLRRGELDRDARVDVFQAFADHFRAKVAFPEEATLGLSDEQYVRNVVDVVFQTATDSFGVKPAVSEAGQPPAPAAVPEVPVR
jgi:uncharacterized RDD family membrane protein YckC